MAVTVLGDDNRMSLRRLIDSGVRVHSVVTDPPYGLTSIVKRFGKGGSAPAKQGTDGAFARASKGFMGKEWDGSGIERDPEFWRLIWEILLPGGFVFAFSGSRTGHWQACAMEQAGFIMHPMHGWVFGSGMPKAHDAAKAIDKVLGTPGEVVPTGDPVKRMIPCAEQNSSGSWTKDSGREYQPGEYLPGSPEALQWRGWKYGTQSQKPALEPIYLGQKPFSEKTGAANLLKHGVGAVNIDGCRVPTNPGVDDPRLGGNGTWKTDKAAKNVYNGGYAGENVSSSPLGRHPANLILDGSSEVVALFPESKGQQGPVGPEHGPRKTVNCFGDYGPRPPTLPRGDEGSAARFFHAFPPDPLVYHPKAGKEDRAGGNHPTVKPIALMQYLIRHVTPPGGTVLDPFAGSGTTGEAALREGFDCILMESEPEYVAFLRERFPAPDWVALAREMLS